MSDERNATPFAFQIIGAGRGGTSMLAGLIDMHPACEVAFETYSWNFLLGRVETPAEEIAHLPSRVAARIDNYIDACGAAARASKATHWGHKTTSEQIRGLLTWRNEWRDPEGFDAVGLFLARTADVPCVYILRDGRSCVESKVRRTGRPLDMSIGNWKFSVDLLRRIRSASTPLIVTRMEDLIAQPVEELKRICAFLGIAYTPAMLTGTANVKMRVEYRRGGFDEAPSILGDRTPPWLGEIAEDLEYCGYAL